MEPTKERLVLPHECLGRLAEETRARYEELADDPQRLVEGLREDARLGLALIECDTVTGLSRWFTGLEGWSADPEELSGALGHAAFGAAWTFHGRHDRGFQMADPPDRSPLSGVQATGREVNVRGFTIIVAEEQGGVERIQLRRYVDWAGAFAQLGLTLNWRVPVPTTTRLGG
jgi:hypothetical protein